MKTKTKSIGNKALGNRTVIGIVCIVAALVICFGVAPLVNRVAEGKVDIVRVCADIPQGKQITENDVELVSVGQFGLPTGVITDKSTVIGKYAAVDLFCDEYVLPVKLTEKSENADDIFRTLDGKHKAISITLNTFSSGLSGKLCCGDIVSAIVYSNADGFAFTPSELRYLKVITSTDNKGIDKANSKDETQPVTVTLLVNDEQANLLVEYENDAVIHFALEYRGDLQTAQKYLDVQEQYFTAKRGDQ